jgi:hypothetical protein
MHRHQQTKGSLELICFLHPMVGLSVLVQDFRLILSQISSSTSSQLSQTRWMWLKKYTTQEQFASIRKLLAAQRESTKSPVWAKCESKCNRCGIWHLGADR